MTGVKLVYLAARLGYHPHIFSTMAESIWKTNENGARKNASEEKQSCFLKIRVLSRQ